MSTEKIQLFTFENLIWFILFGTYVGFLTILGTPLLKLFTFQLVLWSASRLGLLALAEGICLITGNFDLSIGQMTGFIAMVNAMLMSVWVPWFPWYLGILSAILLGTCLGAFNGYLVGFRGLNPFLVTLGTYMVFRSGTLALSLQPIKEGLSPAYFVIGSGKIWGGWPISVFIFFIIILMVYFFLNRTRTGGYLYGVGSNPRVSEVQGVSVSRITFLVFTISGTLCGVAALVYTGYICAATTTLADNTLFPAFAGAVIGGVSLSGGSGKLQGILGGVLLLSTIEIALTMLNIPPTHIEIYFGFLVLIAIAINKLRERLINRILMPS